MIRKGFATLTITLILCAITVLAVFYFSQGVLINAKKIKDDAIYYEAHNAAYSGMTRALKIITDNKKRLPCLLNSKETKKNGTVNNNCYCQPDSSSVNNDSEVTCSGSLSFTGSNKVKDDVLGEYTTTIRHERSGFFNIVSLGRYNDFESTLTSVYQSIGGMKLIPKS
ncbi:MAG: hypothetical protein ACRCR6_06325, partial [Plesiomonas sp.]